MLEYNRVFTKQINPYCLNLSYQIFAICKTVRKMANYYLPQLIQAWQHITSALNK